MTQRPRLLFISLLGGEGTYDPKKFRRLPGGDDDTVWMRMTLDHGDNWFSVQFHPEATADLFATVYGDQPEVLARYRLLPGTERMLLNFLIGTGVLPA